MQKKLSSFIWHFVRLQKWTFLSIGLVSLCWSFDNVLWPYLLKVVIDIFTKYEVERAAAWAALATPALYGLLLWAGIEMGFRAQGFMLMRAIPKLEADIRMEMFDHIQYHSPKYFNEHFAGSLANKITDMTTQVTLVMQQLLTLFFPALLGCLLGIIFFARVNLLFAGILACWIVIHFTICFLFSRRCGKFEHVHGEVRSELLGKIVDSLTNNFAVNLFYRFKFEKARIQTLQTKEQQKNVLSKKQVELMRICMGAVAFTVGGVLTNGLMIYLWLQGKLTTGEVIQIFNTTWNVLMVMWITGMELPGLFQSLGIAKQALSVMKDPKDVLDHPDAKPLLVTKGEIVFANVSFHYGKRSLFRNKDVHIKGGEKVGLVGFSGAGKSTFVNLILRFYAVETGKILVDGQEISKVTLESLRSQISLIPQDPLLFHRSLEENIRFGRIDATKEEVVEAARLAHCDEFIKRLSDGYDTQVGERGTKLSGGERQRIAIARAMLAKAPIILLDEATSALDSVTETYIQESLEKLMQGRTTIVIAHRLSTLAKMDRILVFDQGKIVEEGTHRKLLAKGGHYAKMWQKQAGGFLPDVVPGKEE
ncbi:MAG: ABC transporter ATP-binding protein [Chlamydiales bacterium]|nr:ABC transporter ATP-binding protein [Chlamydiales bacterium]